MNRRKILLIGCGRTGNKLINEMMKKDARYTGIFVNSSYNDMSNLEKFNEETNAFLFTGVNGSGKDPVKAEKYMKDDIQSLVYTITKYPLHDVITIFTSADGGTGSGTVPKLCQTLKLVFNQKGMTNKKINVVAVFPTIKRNDRISFKNAIRFWNKIVSIKDDIIDNILIVDNTKGDTYKEINEKVVTSIHNAYSMNGVHDEGEIDDEDARRFNTSKGFGLILNLDSDYKDASLAIDKAMENSIFALPNTLSCDYIGVSLKESDYLIDDVLSHLPDARRTIYKTYNNKHNTIVLGGCSAPQELIWNIKNSLEEMDRKEMQPNADDNLMIDIDDMNDIKPKTISKEKERQVYTEDDIDNIVSALQDLWD